MLDTVMRLAGFDLQRQIARLRAQAEDFKDRAIDDVKHKIADVGLTIGLAFGGLILSLFTLIAVLIAFYLWVAKDHGPFVALGVVALSTGILAILLFTIAASRGGKAAPKRAPRVDNAASAASDAPRSSASAAHASAASPSHVSMYDSLAETLADKTFVPRATVDSAVEIVRTGPREAVLATLAAAVVVGLVMGRRR
jgi:hypothetical protein